MRSGALFDAVSRESALTLNNLFLMAATLVVFLGDNGSEPQTGEGNFDDGRGKGTPFESGVRVPLVFVDGEALRHTIARGEPRTDVQYRYTPGAVVGEPSSIVDLYATLVDVLALDPGTCTPGVDCARDSRSMREVLDGGPPARDAVWAERFLTMGGGVVGEGAVRIGDTKLYVHTAAAEPCRRYLMYDLASDRWERTNLFFKPERLDEKRALLAELELHAAAMAGTANDWLAYDACCEAKDAWYDGVDSDCDGADDYDQDGDGSAYAFDGGGDCDDVDPAVHPGAVDPPGDGVDADCDGYDGPPPDDTAGDTASDTDPPADTDTDGGDPDDRPCGCATTPGAGAAAALGAVFALRRRRR
jgi:MYXO-CTERM domain-containing protein